MRRNPSHDRVAMGCAALHPSYTLMGTVVLVTGSPRVGIVSVLLLFGIGVWLLSRVDIERGEQRVNAGT
ncbi:hypothetical protein TspCOW1_30170 [Thiohalobacter sp. COW1]|nr:hypothetical protein TspCOW1_30170 [Thiohalobacter sp. COW1]